MSTQQYSPIVKYPDGTYFTGKSQGPAFSIYTDDYGKLVGESPVLGTKLSNFATNAALINQAISQLNAAGGGRIHCKRFNINVNKITLLPNVSLEFEPGTILNQLDSICIDIVGTGQPFFARSALLGDFTINPGAAAGNTKGVVIEDTNLVYIEKIAFNDLSNAPANYVGFEINGGFRNRIRRIWGNSSGAVASGVVLAHLGANSGSSDTANANILDQIVAQQGGGAQGGTALLMDGAVDNKIFFLDAENAGTASIGLQIGHPNNTYSVAENLIDACYLENVATSIKMNYNTGLASTNQIVSNLVRIINADVPLSHLSLQTPPIRILYPYSLYPAKSSSTAGTSPFTFPLLEYDAIYVLTTVGGLSALTLDGQALTPINAIGDWYFVKAGHSLIATWATTAPVFQILPQV